MGNRGKTFRKLSYLKVHTCTVFHKGKLETNFKNIVDNNYVTPVHRFVELKLSFIYFSLK